MKKKVVSIIIAGMIVATILPSVRAKAEVKRDLAAGEVVTVQKTEEEFILNITKEDNYTVFSNMSTEYNNQVKLNIYNEQYNVIESGTSNLNVRLKPGKYFVKIQSALGTPLNCDFSVVPELSYNELENVDVNSSAVMFKLSDNFEGIDSQLIVDTCENKDETEDTKITLLDNKLDEVTSNDDISDGCKYSRLRITSKAKSDISKGEDYYIKIESKNDSKLSTGVAFTEDNTRHQPFMNFVGIKNGGYYLNGEELALKVYGNPSATNIKLEYRGSGYNNQDKIVDFGVMAKDEKSNTFKTTIKPNQSNHVYGVKSGKEYVSPQFVAVNTDWHSIKTETNMDGYIAYYDRAAYEYMDHSWYYNSPFDHSFKGYATDNYNCMAYGLGVTDEYIWPWSPQASGIDYEAVCRFFSKQGSHSNRNGYRYTEFSKEKMVNAQAIYYEGHVAVITEWDSQGMPTKIVSKWGGNELVESTIDGLVRWGEPLIYMKGRQAN